MIHPELACNKIISPKILVDKDQWRVERCLEADRQDEKKRLEKERCKEKAKQIPASDQGGILLYAYRSDQFEHDPIWMGPVKVEVGTILEESWW